MKARLTFAGLAGTTIVIFVFLWPPIDRSQNLLDADRSSAANHNPQEMVPVSEMVPVEAILENELDSRRIQNGQRFEASLTRKIQLKNDQVLPKETALLGTVVKNDIQADGTATVVLRFTEARTKAGKSVPIVATVTGFAPPVIYFGISDYTAEDTPPSPWDGKSLEIDQLRILPGLDLHSRIADVNSAVFVSTRKEKVRLLKNSQIFLVIAPISTTRQDGLSNVSAK